MLIAAIVMALVFAVGVAVLPRVIEQRRHEITPELRKRAEGQFAQLSQGKTHFQWAGGVRGPVIVMIHGLTTPQIVWDGITPELTALGFRVLRYDLYGRGFSDAPVGAQSIAFFNQQLSDLLADQKVTENITLMGYSMGGSIAAAYSAAHPDRVARVILVAPAGIEEHVSRFDRLCRCLPAVGDWMHGMFAAGRMRRGSQKPADIAGMQDFQLSRRGFLPAVLSSRRHALTQTQEAAHRSLGRDDIPVWAIWGREDKTIPLAAMGTLTRWNRAVQHDDIAGAGHGLPYTHAAELAASVGVMLRTR